MSQMRRSRSEAWESGRVPSFQLRSIVSGANKQISYVNADAIYAMLVNSMPPCLKTNIDQTLSSLTLAHDFIQVQFDVLYHLVRVVIVSATLRSRASDVCLKIGHTPPPERSGRTWYSPASACCRLVSATCLAFNMKYDPPRPNIEKSITLRRVR